jgi:hypothetical protein
VHRPTPWLLACVVALVVAPSVLLGPAARPVGAQQVDVPFAGVRAEVLAEGRQDAAGGRVLQPYRFTFEGPVVADGEGASLPGQGNLIESQSSMVVKVEKGGFAFGVEPEDVAVVDPRGERIQFLAEESGQPSPTYDYTYPAEYVQDDTGDCRTLCAIPPDRTVLIEEGDTVYLPRRLACFLCAFDTDDAELLVFVIQDPTGGAAGTPAASPDPRGFEWVTGDGIVDREGRIDPNRRHWANPSTRCQ